MDRDNYDYDHWSHEENVLLEADSREELQMKIERLRAEWFAKNTPSRWPLSRAGREGLYGIEFEIEFSPIYETISEEVVS